MYWSLWFLAGTGVNIVPGKLGRGVGFAANRLYNCPHMKDMLRKLVQAESTIGRGELATAEIIAAELGRGGIDSRIDRWGSNRANIVARISSARRKAGLLFVCHLDVVGPGEGEWEYEPFSATESNGKIFGRGAADMKGGIAAAVAAIRETIDSGVKPEGDIIFAATAGEETDSCGVKKFIQDYKGQLPELAGVVIPEPTDFKIITSHRGLLWLNLVTRGKTAHGSTPQLGINAISSMRAVLNELENFKILCQPHELLGNCSMSVNTISGGNEINVVPDKCTIGIDIRTLPGQRHGELIGDFEKIFAGLKKRVPQFEAEIAVVRDVKPLETDSGCEFVKDFCSAVGISRTSAVGYTTDGPFFAESGTPVVVFGPGKPELCHKPDEYIDISDVEKAVEYYKKIIMEFLT